ncbi:MAG TPA: DUF2877 domain-containing protein [Anaerolineales bacterium]|nr:DUF2877 domain-containing protein [Anaerolineales bacterium]
MGYAIPSEDFIASVHSAFRSALNLCLQTDKYLLTLIASSEGDLPQGIRLDVPDGFSFEDFRLGGLVICRNDILHFEENSLNIQLSEARRWKCDLPALKFDPAEPAVSAAWSFVWEALSERQRLSEAGIVAGELLDESAWECMPRRAAKAIRDLQHAARQYKLNISAVEQLIGLGSGLTPSGDDLLVGYLAGLWCTVQGNNARMQFAARLGEAIVGFSSKTNDISRTYLYHAAQGQVSSRLSDLAEAICRGANPERLNEVAEAAFKVGHTSGMDAVTGLLIGLAVWMPHSPIGV